MSHFITKLHPTQKFKLNLTLGMNIYVHSHAGNAEKCRFNSVTSKLVISVFIIHRYEYKRNGNYGSKKSTVTADIWSVILSTDYKLTFAIPMIAECALGLHFPLVNLA